VLIALGESVIAIGVGASFKLIAPVLGAAALGFVVISALWWLYFDVAAIFARRALVHAVGVTQAKLARDAYSYLHLPMVAGIVLFALALETTVHGCGGPEPRRRSRRPAPTTSTRTPQVSGSASSSARSSSA
jgi:low temperature requirement protein LtrA